MGAGRSPTLRARHGLPPGGNPLIEGQYSPHLNLALFSRVMAEPQPDWPARTRVTGFVFYNGPAALAARSSRRFSTAGPPPVVFTLGSSAVGAAGRFYHESAAAAARLGVRAVLLTGGFAANQPARVPDGVLLVDRAPHQLLFPRARAVVHQGGAGTTAQALRAGCPMLVVPHSHDQPDNAYRVTRLGVARTLYPKRYTAARAAHELRRLLDDPAYRRSRRGHGRRRAPRKAGPRRPPTPSPRSHTAVADGRRHPMPLDHYVTLGRSGLRVSPFCLGAMTFGEDWGFGSTVPESEAIMARYFERGGNFIDTANGYTGGHSETHHRQLHRATTARGAIEIVIATKFFSNLSRRNPNGGGASRKADRGLVRAVAAAPADRLHRSLLDARVGSVHAHRRDDAGARRSGARRQGALHRLLRHAGVEGGAGADASRSSAAGRRSSRCRSSIRSSSARSRASSCRWRASSASASRRGRRLPAAC